MATIASLRFFSRLSLPPSRRSRSQLSFDLTHFSPTKNPRKFQTLTLVRASSSSFDDLRSERSANSRSKKSVLSNLIQEIEPLDVSLIQKDVLPTTVDAMKRTISGMLGLLPSDQFHVVIEALWLPLSKLLVSSMMTGYTLRNAEYRLCLERNLDIYEGNTEKQRPEISKSDELEMLLDSADVNKSGKHELSSKSEENTENPSEGLGIQGLGEMTAEAQQYFLHLQTQLSSVKKELCEVKRKNAALQMQQFVGEEQNDLLDYLRSLQPEKVAELSEPATPELKEIIHSAVHGLLATLSPKMHSKAPLSENTSTGVLNVGNEDCTELVENTSVQFQPLISLTRDYLARLLFWSGQLLSCFLLLYFLLNYYFSDWMIFVN
ncbi:hypothetical protein PVL29_003300 [Vitis rotundifolia]|uniref:MAR-binding filament-like protein 1 n=1 Tax=Vitis rotundifolia TaxID=103349 RepID=A0AA39E2W6_VITRO|nr:hypothetical protein PVL29_003300 [Vitis rotundifolia]